MTLRPLEELRIDLRSHRSALGWLLLLYRKPKVVEHAAEGWSTWRVLLLILRFYIHALPYLLLLASAGRWLLFEFLDLEPRSGIGASHWVPAEQLAIGLVIGLTFGLATGLAFGLERAVNRGMAAGIAAAVALGSFLEIILSGGGSLRDWLAVALALGFWGGLGDAPFDDYGEGPFAGLAVGLAVALSLGFSGGFSTGLADGFVGGLADRSASGLAIGLAGGLAYCCGFYRIYYLPLHLFLVWPEPRPRLYSWHPAAWDGRCKLRFPRLHRLLVAHAELLPPGEDEIDRLIDEHPAQRRQALRAKTVLVARQAARIGDLARLDGVLADLPEGKQGFLRQTAEIRRKAQEITRLQVRLDTLERHELKEPFAELLVKTIGEFENQIAGFREPLVTEFRQAAKAWRQLAEAQRAKVRAAMEKAPTRQVFRAGDPVVRESEAFLFRAGPAGELEQQVMLATGCPGLLIYGRRRMGKSTLILNLPGFLPPSVDVLYLSMQSARAFGSLPAWVARIEEKLLEVVHVEAQHASDLMGLERLLERVDRKLAGDGRRVLLAIDEYEQLDLKIAQGTFTEDLLAAVRESIQSHRHLTWAFVGSHRIDELKHAPWASYLVSARTVEVEPFSPAETRLLLTQPMKHSTLWRYDESKRPRFEPGFWGDGGIDRIHHATGGWPHLVQLVAETVIDELNLAGRPRVDTALLERSLDTAARRGDSVFHQLLVGESALDGELDYLENFADHETQPPPDDKPIRRSLRRRLLVVPENGEWRLRAPIMSRWLRRRL